MKTYYAYRAFGFFKGSVFDVDNTEWRDYKGDKDSNIIIVSFTPELLRQLELDEEAALDDDTTLTYDFLSLLGGCIPQIEGREFTFYLYPKGAKAGETAELNRILKNRVTDLVKVKSEERGVVPTILAAGSLDELHDLIANTKGPGHGNGTQKPIVGPNNREKDPIVKIVEKVQKLDQAIQSSVIVTVSGTEEHANKNSLSCILFIAACGSSTVVFMAGVGYFLSLYIFGLDEYNVR